MSNFEFIHLTLYVVVHIGTPHLNLQNSFFTLNTISLFFSKLEGGAYGCTYSMVQNITQHILYTSSVCYSSTVNPVTYMQMTFRRRHEATELIYHKVSVSKSCEFSKKLNYNFYTDLSEARCLGICFTSCFALLSPGVFPVISFLKSR